MILFVRIQVVNKPSICWNTSEKGAVTGKIVLTQHVVQTFKLSSFCASFFLS